MQCQCNPPKSSSSVAHRLPPSSLARPRPQLPTPPQAQQPPAWRAQYMAPTPSSSSSSTSPKLGLRSRRRTSHGAPSCFAELHQPSEEATTAPSALDLPIHLLQAQAQASRVQAAPATAYAVRKWPLPTSRARQQDTVLSPATSRCFRCGGAGHWASQCTQQPVYVRPVSTAAAAAALPGSCFRCGQPGHWANSCPQPAQPQRASPPPAAAGPEASDAALPGTCFRCGQQGHWVKDCPEAQDPSLRPASDLPESTPLPHFASLFPSSRELLLPSHQPGYLRHHLRADQRSQDWLSARDTRLTASAVLKAVGINPAKIGAHGASPRRSLFNEKLGITEVKMNPAMMHGVRNEATAIQEYCRLTGSTVAACDFVTYQQAPEAEAASLQLPGGIRGPGDAWIGGSPDGLVLGTEAAVQALHRLAAAAERVVVPQARPADDEVSSGLSHRPLDLTPSKELVTLMDKAGILEIKCPMTPGTGDAEKNSKYLFQIQALMEILDLGWADLFIYSLDKELLQVRVQRDPGFWAELLPHIRSFWWEHLVPARQALQARRQAAGGEMSREQQKAAVKEYLPSALPGNATARLQEWARDMYERADKDVQLSSERSVPGL